MCFDVASVFVEIPLNFCMKSSVEIDRLWRYLYLSSAIKLLMSRESSSQIKLNLESYTIHNFHSSSVFRKQIFDVTILKDDMSEIFLTVSCKG